MFNSQLSNYPAKTQKLRCDGNTVTYMYTIHDAIIKWMCVVCIREPNQCPFVLPESQTSLHMYAESNSRQILILKSSRTANPARIDTDVNNTPRRTYTTICRYVLR